METIEKTCENAADSFTKRWLPFSNEVPDQLFHYTTLDGTFGILNSSSIWAGYALQTNDEEEIRHGLALCIEEFKNFRFSFYTSGQNLKNNIINFLESERKRPRMDIFLVCFTTNDDQLSQWRGYANQGNGGCIGLDTNFFRHEGGIPIVQVIYDQPSKIAKIHALLRDFDNMVSGIISGTPGGTIQSNQAVEHVYRAIITGFLLLSCGFKNEGFKEENEWRLVQFIPHVKKTSFLAHGRFVRMYFHIKIVDKTKKALSSIRLGPCVPVGQEYIFEKLLKKKRYAFTTTRSKIPFLG
jgi:hypothetical protein